MFQQFTHFAKRRRLLQGWDRYLPHLVVLITIILFAARANNADAAGFCATPGKDGTANISGTVNTYYPVTATVSAGATSITLGTPTGATTVGISPGDMLLVIQIQDVDFDMNNSNSYGSGGTSGSGYTNIRQAGKYEYVKATSTLTAGATGSVSIANPGLANNYTYRAPTPNANGASRFQVIRVPQYSAATVTGTLTAPVWNGSTGGIVAIDVAGILTLNSDIDVNGRGFRGGWGETSGAGGPNTAYRTRANVNGNGMKGEGIAGTPNRMNRPASFTGTPATVTTGGLGYPGSGDATNVDYAKAMGAPGNAGGGGTDGNNANAQNSGGGGGGNYSAGGNGGHSWSSNLDVGGRGGSLVPVAFDRIFFGGGGGAGSTNDGTGDNNTYANNNAIACSLTAGNCSSGAPGGGIVIIRARAMTGSGSVLARGSHAYNVLQDGGGGGGAGGTVILETSDGGSATVNVSGGDGGNTWRTQAPNGTPGERHGPGGGGSGGFIAYSPNGSWVSATYTGGVYGTSTTANDSYGSGGGTGGTYAYQIPSVPGSNTGYDCSPKLTKSYSATDIGVGGSTTLTFTITNGANNQAQSGLAFTDTFPAGLTVTGVSAIAGSGCSGTPGSTSSTVTLSAGAMTAGTVTCTFTATIRGDTSGTYVNDTSRLSGVSSVLSTSTMSATLNVRQAALTKSYDNGNIAETSVATLTFTLTNGTGNPAQTSLTFTDTLTAGSGLTVTGVTPLSGSGCSATTPAYNATSPASVTLTGATMTAGTASCTFSVTVQGNSAGTYPNTAASISSASAAIDSSAVNAPLTVIGAPPQAVGTSKPLYLYDSGTYKLSRTPMGTTANYVTIPRGNNTQTWTLNPALNANVTVNSGTIPVVLWMSTNSARTYSVPVTLSCGSTTVATLTQPAALTGTITSFTFNLNLAANYTCSLPNNFTLSVTNTQGTGGTPRDIRVHPAPSAGNTSKVTLSSQNVISVDSITLYDGAYPPLGNQLASALTNSTVYIRATVSDPFGAYDINANPPTTRPTLTITDKNGLVALPASAMTELGGLTTAGTKTFEYAYSVPPAGPVGNWLLRVDAVEGTEGLVSHYRQSIMPVIIPQPLISILKFADAATANPNQTVTYTVQIVNSGAGAGSNVVLTDALSTYTSFGITPYSTGVPFDFINSSPASGLSLGTPEYSFDYGSNWTPTTPSGGVNAPAGFNGNVTNWKILMTGNIRAGGSISLIYQVKVK